MKVTFLLSKFYVRNVFTLMNSSTCLSLKKLNNFTVFITPDVVKWIIHIKSLVAAPTLLVLHVSIIDCTIA